MHRASHDDAIRTMLPTPMRTPAPIDPHQAALRSMIRRFVWFFAAGMLVIAAFVVAWLLGAFAPSRP
jgi:hypothetical protein